LGTLLRVALLYLGPEWDPPEATGSMM